MMPRTLILLVGLLLGGCLEHHFTDSGVPAIDGGSAMPPPCEPAAELEAVPTLRHGPLPTTPPRLAIERALADTSIGRYVVAIQQANLTELPSLSLLVVTPDGRIERTIPIVDEPGADLHFDVAVVPDGWMVVGASRWTGHREEGSETWFAHVRRAGGPVLRVALIREELGAISALTTAARTDGAVDVYTVRGGELFHQVLREGELSAPAPLEVSFEPGTSDHRMIATRAGASTCIAAIAFPSGRGWAVRLSGDAVASAAMFAERGLVTLPVPEPLAGDCAIAYFEPDLRFPTRGEVRFVGAGAATGWGGTHPLGLALLPGARRVAVAVPSPLFPDRVEEHVVELEEGVCRTVSPSLIRPVAAQPLPLGALVAATLGENTLLFEAGLDGAGVLTAARVR